MAMSSERTKTLVEIALVIALAAVLNTLKVWRMPQGGTVSLVMLPIFVIALRRGPLVGIVTGALYGVIDFFVDPYPPVHWAQYLLDYPVAYAACGLAGVFQPLWRRFAREPRVALAGVASGVVLGSLARYAAHVISGVIFFAEYAEGPVLAYSLAYNVYVPISAAACLAAALVILPTLERAGRGAPTA
ncbi:MAG: energy-coupled thiamine transporter ThiT [Coriobacteriales bacterium]|nr:energy-coupled thiamine transporter ThiT [Actinomycetes bacterium]